MRQVLSLSLPPQATVELKTLARKRGFVSVSGYVQHLIDLDKDLISESRLLRSVKEAERDHKIGRTIKAKSIANLL